ncbi:hypothetical protein SV7mr_30620 [Stieleria bergensis]|uniref:Sulfatase n=1 Tax=Stieleria bergensis TaxID=2528025 RepID=A0A517SWN0_9BACT|nr:hypothetical protein SV7mr_30620 [Planctomycetes bacterium SV_7m_r]
MQTTDLLKRREFLRQGTLGIGSLALSHLLTTEVQASGLHHAPRAKNVIFLHMVGGPSQMDTFDPKPELDKWDGKSLPSELTKGQKFAFITPEAKAIKSPYKFAPRGDCGMVMSELFPQLATVADELTMIRSMQTNEINHGSGELFLHTGHGRLGRPTFGAWTSYGLGTENENLPAYVVLKDKHPNAGPAAWSSGFLPSRHQGVEFRTGAKPLFYLENPTGVNSGRRKDVIDTLGQLNSLAFDRYHDPEIETRINQYELAYQMQTSVPELADFASEPDHVLKMYGLDQQKAGQDFAKNCLLARRLVQRGVRFVQIFNMGWDHHQSIYNALPKSAKKVDQACAALIKDLKQRDLLKDTLVIWGGEFGRTPMVQENNAGTGAKTPPGRDHHKECFSIWMAGGGMKPGLTYGSTDEFGFGVAEKPVHVHDFHATCLHLLGIDHERLTHRHQGRDFRLTDVHGHVVHDIIA